MYNFIKLSLPRFIILFSILSSFIGLSGCSTMETKSANEIADSESVVYKNGYQAAELDYFFNLIKNNVPSLSDLSNLPGQISPLTFKDFKLEGRYSDLWQRIVNGYGLDYDEDNPKIQAAIKRFSKYTRYFDIISTKAHPYLYHIVAEAEKRGIPLELALLPAIESSFDPTALSSRSAAGLWQFMPGTGKNFGLARNKWYDGRRDVIASTEAAMDYLEKLHNFFDGDWLLAIGAYNYGEGNMQKAISRNEAAGKPTDFWSLSLPTETSQFVPSLIAVSKIIAEHERYGVTLNHIPDEPYLAQVTLNEQISLSLAAKLADLPMSDFKRLNPGYRKSTTGPHGPHCITLPIDKVSQFEQSLAHLLPDEFVSVEMLAAADIEEDEQPVRYSQKTSSRKSIAQVEDSKATKKPDVKTANYQVGHGDTLFKIAQRYDTSVKTLRQLNGMKSNYLKVGQAIKVPDTGKQIVAETEEAPRTSQKHTVQKGDTLTQIAKRYNTSVDELRRLNNVNNNNIRVGQTLKVSGVSDQPASNDKKKVMHTVKSGDSLWTIARDYEVSIDKLSQWNKLHKRESLRLGQELTIWKDG